MTERLSFRTEKSTRRKLEKQAKAWGYRSLSAYLREAAEAPLNPERLRIFRDRYDKLLSEQQQ